MVGWIKKIEAAYLRRRERQLSKLTADQREEVAQLSAVVMRYRLPLVAIFLLLWLMGVFGMRVSMEAVSWFEAILVPLIAFGGIGIGLLAVFLQPCKPTASSEANLASPSIPARRLFGGVPTWLKLSIIAVACTMAGAIVGGLIGKFVKQGFQGMVLAEIQRVAIPVLIAGLMVGVIYALLTAALLQLRRNLLIRKNEELKASAQQERVARQLTDAKLRLMQAQVEPHFLFNTLASVQHLAEARSPEAARLTAQLITFLRGGLSGLREECTTLEREFIMVESYLLIMKTRMDERLEFSLDLPRVLVNESIPPAMLISLVENAIKHGLEPQPQGGRIDVVAQRTADGPLTIRVSDTGRGVARAGGSANRLEGGLGLGNIRDRLHAIYGERAALETMANVPRGFVATLMVPSDKISVKEE